MELVWHLLRNRLQLKIVSENLILEKLDTFARRKVLRKKHAQSAKSNLIRTAATMLRTPGVSKSNCSLGQMRTYKVAREPYYDVEATMAVPEP